jgi:hypothetical protein
MPLAVKKKPKKIAGPRPATARLSADHLAQLRTNGRLDLERRLAEGKSPPNHLIPYPINGTFEEKAAWCKANEPLLNAEDDEGGLKEPLDGVLRKAWRKLIRNEVFTPKIHVADLKPLPVEYRPGETSLTARAGEALRKRRLPGDPSFATGMLFAAKVQYFTNTSSMFLCLKSHVEIAAVMEGCKETVRKCERMFERLGLIDTFNTVHRQGNTLERGPNVLLIRTDDDGVLEDRAAEVKARIARWAPALDLIPGRYGLNSRRG